MKVLVVNSAGRLIAALLTSLFAAGCATVISPSQLKAVTATEEIVLKSDFTYFSGSKGGPFGALAGVYRAEYTDGVGTFYRGSGTCAFLYNKQPTTDGTVGLVDGGIYVRRVGGKSVVGAYRYLWINSPTPNVSNQATSQVAAQGQANPVQVGAAAGLGAGIAQSMIASERGKIALMPVPATDITLEEITK
jgi:hypothetical protein